MTPEELQAWSNSDEGKAFLQEQINSHVQTAGYKKPEEVSGLVAKRDELLGEVTKNNDLIKKAFETLGVKDKLEFKELLEKKAHPNASQSELGLIQKASQLEATLKRVEEDKQGSDEKLSKYEQSLVKLQASSEIQKALILEGESEARAKLLAKSLMSEAGFSLQDDLTVKSKDGLNPGDWFKRWKDGDGKEILPAHGASGGDFKPGGGGGAGEKQKLLQRRTELTKGAMGPSEQSELIALNQKIKQLN